MTGQVARLEAFGTGYRVTVAPLGAELLFRDVVVGSELRADVTVRHDGRHLFRSTSTLALSGRDKVARVAADLDGGEGEAWRLAVFAATEAVIEAEESLGRGVDLRYASAAQSDTAMVVDGFFPAATTVVVAPNEAGKSTLGRAIALSVASGETIIPGLRPMVVGPVLYVAGEDPVVEYHAKNVNEIADGAGLDRRRVRHPIYLVDARGRSLNRLVRSLAERAQDCVAIILDSYQALLGAADDGGIRDRDGLYWNAIDQLGRPTLTLGHPNRADRQSWGKADGSLAGSDVGQDRPRCRWKINFKDDEDATVLGSVRRYSLICQKWSDFVRDRPTIRATGRLAVRVRRLRSGPLAGRAAGRTPDNRLCRDGRRLPSRSANACIPGEGARHRPRHGSHATEPLR
jgi:hypothetical protein